MILTGDNSQLVYQSSLAAPSTVRLCCQQRHLCCSSQYWLVSCPPRHLWSEWEVGEENENLVYPSPWDVKRSLTCRKILRHGTSGFTSHPKGGVLWIFIHSCVLCSHVIQYPELNLCVHVHVCSRCALSEAY
jgi:hypothetical protein